MSESRPPDRTLDEEIDDLREGRSDLDKAFDRIVATLRVENAALREEIKLLEARLDERRTMGTSNTTNKLVEKSCERCGKNLGLVYNARKFCRECVTVRHREVLEQNLSARSVSN